MVPKSRYMSFWIDYVRKIHILVVFKLFDLLTLIKFDKHKQEFDLKYCSPILIDPIIS